MFWMFEGFSDVFIVKEILVSEPENIRNEDVKGAELKSGRPKSRIVAGGPNHELSSGSAQTVELLNHMVALPDTLCTSFYGSKMCQCLTL